MKSVLRKRYNAVNRSLKGRAFVNFKLFLTTLFRSTSHPIADEMLSLLSEGKFTALIDLADGVASTVYRSPAEHLLLNQLAALIRKYPWPPSVVPFDKRGRALEKFKHSEHVCSRVNKRFAIYRKRRSPHEFVLAKARSWIAYTLGDVNLPSIYDQCNFGPGASVGVSGRCTNQARKILAKDWTLTPGAFYLARSAVSCDQHLLEYCLQEDVNRPYCIDLEKYKTFFASKARLIDYNKITFVPKTAKVDRTIAVEPLLNGYLQKGVDQFMRNCLKRVGIDLSDQTRNQELARKGSLYDPDPYVTIDLSSASDSISIELCRYILPEDWFYLLDQLRSRCYLLEGKKFVYEKFTTMGNGFCFPLETLIFASLCTAVYAESHRQPDFSVYGDDIIVRQSVANRVLELLKVCGFSANPDKTFLEGPFRESCGADWFEGKDVRPMSLDYAFDSLENIFKFCNQSRSKGTWEGILKQGVDFLVTLIPRDVLFVRPYSGQIDTALEVPLDVFMASSFARYDRNVMSWSWIELLKTASPDIPVKRVAGYNVALMRGALTGVMSPIPFAERRKTRTKIRRLAYSGATSNWVPGVTMA